VSATYESSVERLPYLSTLAARKQWLPRRTLRATDGAEGRRATSAHTGIQSVADTGTQPAADSRAADSRGARGRSTGSQRADSESPEGPTRSVRVLSYNLLADYYVTQPASLLSLFAHVPLSVLNARRRLPLAAAEIARHDADVICLQEVQAHAHTQTCTHAHTCTRTHTRAHAYTHTRACAHTQTHTQRHMDTRTHAHARQRTRACASFNAPIPCAHRRTAPLALSVRARPPSGGHF
jgi:hypothetical protein